jgi:hypothetical protein
MQDQLCSASLTEYFWQGQLYSALPTESFLLNQAAYLLKNSPHPTNQYIQQVNAAGTKRLRCAELTCEPRAESHPPSLKREEFRLLLPDGGRSRLDVISEYNTRDSDLLHHRLNAQLS